MILETVPHSNTGLHTVCEKYSFISPQLDIVEFVTNLVETMRSQSALGLSANQVGVNLAIFSMETEPAIVVVNPKIIETSEETILLEEKCMSFPNLIVKVKRPLWVRARFNYPNGEAKTHRFEGMSARVFQHEYAHLQGRTMIDDTNSYYRERANKQLKKSK
jgi:peptide deformylase